MSLPLKLPLDQMSTKWKAEIDPVLANPLVQGRLVTGVSLVAGVNAINHGLGRKPLGWFITDRTTSASLYSEQAFNPAPESTLWLVSSGTGVIDLWIF